MGEKQRDLPTEAELAWIDFWLRADEKERAEVGAAYIRAKAQGGLASINIVQDRRSLGQRVLAALRGKVRGEPQGVSEHASQWWFILGWVTRGCAIGQPDDEVKVIESFLQFSLAIGESRRVRTD